VPYNNELAHWIEAGCDAFVMPSRYEPCGLNQIYSLKYGTVPIVRKTGGLADTVQLYDSVSQIGSGFVFEYFKGDSLRWAIDYAYNTFQNQNAWKKIMLNGMQQNFSWEVQVEKYIELYQKIQGWW
jgi:starch synthase